MSSLALQLIEKEKTEKTGRLDLGNCGLTEIPPALFDLPWLEELIVSNRWWDWEKRKWLDSQNKGPKNRLSALPSALHRLQNLRKLVMDCEPADSWQISDYSFMEKLTDLTSLYLRSNHIRDYSFLEKLTKLTSLDLSFNQIINIRFLEKLTSLSSLYLGFNQIRDIRFLKTLTKLTSLDLSSNQIRDYSFLEKLTNLSFLDLRFNQISDIRFLETLTNLKFLYLRRNQISDISFLTKLTELSSLDIGYNIISDISFLEKLTKLSFLSLSDNQISDHSFLEKLTSLTSLFLSSNQIRDYSFLEKLTKLSFLDLGTNQISDIRFLEKLTSLTSLYLRGNHISDYSFLTKLTSLTSLNLSYNQISDISLLAKLTSLTSLDLTSNQITDITFLTKLTSLTSLFLSSNQITDLSPLLPLIKKGISVKWEAYGSGISVNNNPFTNPPIEIVKQGNDAILRYFEEQKKGTIPNNEIRLILVGNSTSGKTSLSLFLRERKYRKNQSTTHGGDLMKVWTPENFDLKINIWDFGGQEFYHATHRLFLSDNAVYVLVWDIATNRSGFEDTPIYYIKTGFVTERLEHFPYSYWLSGIRHYAQKSQVLLARNKCEKTPEDYHRVKDAEIKRFALGPSRFEFEISIEKAYEYHQDGQNTDASEWARSFEVFEKNLLRTLLSAASRHELIRYWVDIRDEIIGLSETKRSLSLKEYETLCSRHDDTPDTELAMIYLRDICGVALHYPNNPLLKNQVYIDANWVNQRIYTVLNYDVRNRHGRFDFAHAQHVLDVKEGEAAEMIALMKEFELIFEDGQQPGHFIASQYLPHEAPTTFESNKHFANLESKPLFTMRFPDFLPRSVIARFIARKGFQAVHNQYWKFGILFTENLSALVECKYEDVPFIEVSIQKAGERQQKAVGKDIFDTLLEIMEKETGFEVSVDCERWVDYGKLTDQFHAKAREVKSATEEWMQMSDFGFLFDKRLALEIRKSLVEELDVKSALQQMAELHPPASSYLNRLTKGERDFHQGIIPYSEWDQIRQKVFAGALNLLEEIENGTSDISSHHSEDFASFKKDFEKLFTRQGQILKNQESFHAHLNDLIHYAQSYQEYILPLITHIDNHQFSLETLQHIETIITKSMAALAQKLPTTDELITKWKEANQKLPHEADYRMKLKFALPFLPVILEKEVNFDAKESAKLIWQSLKDVATGKKKVSELFIEED